MEQVTGPVYDPDFKPPDWAAEVYTHQAVTFAGQPHLLAHAQQSIRDILEAAAHPLVERTVPAGSCPHAYWRRGNHRDYLIQCQSPEACRVADLNYGEARKVLDYLVHYSDVNIWELIRTVAAEQIGWALEELDCERQAVPA
jgi:hypothetical protein